MDDIAAAPGVGKGTLFRAFGSRDGLGRKPLTSSVWLGQMVVAMPRRVSARQGHNQAMASSGADENTPAGGGPGPRPVTDQTGHEPVQLIAMSDAASRMGALMLGSGTGSFRVLQAMRQVAAALGIDRLQAQVTLTHIVSTATRRGIFRTQVVEVPTPSVNADRIAALQTIARDLPEGSSVAELHALLDEVGHRAALYGTRWLVLAAAVACAAFAFLNNGGWAECLVVFAAAACGTSPRWRCAR